MLRKTHNVTSDISYFTDQSPQNCPSWKRAAENCKMNHKIMSNTDASNTCCNEYQSIKWLIFYKNECMTRRNRQFLLQPNPWKWLPCEQFCSPIISTTPHLKKLQDFLLSPRIIWLCFLHAPFFLFFLFKTWRKISPSPATSDSSSYYTLFPSWHGVVIIPSLIQSWSACILCVCMLQKPGRGRK